MELEFDKEIDALLRKAKLTAPLAAVAPAAGSHLDADELSAFAENALPDRTRQMYVAHLADCDECRKMLSTFISVAPARAATAAAFAAAPEPDVITHVPWYKRLMRGPNLAYTMGALVVVFAGLFGLLLLQYRQPAANSMVSQVANREPAAREPSTDERSEGTSNTTAANSAANSASSSPVQDVTKSGVAVGTSNPETVEQQPTETQRADSGNVVASAKPVDQPAANPAAAPPPPPVMKEEAPDVTGRDVYAGKQALDKTKDDRTLLSDESKKKVAEDNKLLREAPQKSATPMRAGPKQQQNVQSNMKIQQNQVDGLAVGAGVANNAIANRRSVGGKSFEMRGGVWYDSAYHGGGTKDIKRGTENFLRLDEGLRSIANSLGGTVVVVWNGKAYKIK